MGSIGVQAEGISFYKASFKDALAKAKAQDKLVFIDAYTTWCGPCKAMAKTVFKEKVVGDFYNSNFINLKIDMEKGEGPALAQKYKVRAYPTFLFVDGDGKIVVESKGRKRTKQFINLGKAALKKFDKSVPLAEEYEKGNRKPEFLKKYALALVRAKKPHLKVANEYLKTQEDLTTEDNLNAIFAFATEADSKVFDLLLKYKKAITKLHSAKAVEQVIEKACFVTVQKAVDYQYKELMNEAKEVMSTHYPKKAKRFILEADMKFALGSRNAEDYLKFSKKYIAKYAKNDAKVMIQTANHLDEHFSKNTKAKKQAEKYAKKAVALSPTVEYQMTYARILANNNKTDAAVKVAKQALKTAKKKNLSTREIEHFLRIIQS